MFSAYILLPYPPAETATAPILLPRAGRPTPAPPEAAAPPVRPADRETPADELVRLRQKTISLKLAEVVAPYKPKPTVRGTPV